jgi:hypothetical protein
MSSLTLSQILLVLTVTMKATGLGWPTSNAKSIPFDETVAFKGCDNAKVIHQSNHE